MQILQCGDLSLDLSQSHVMGILNVTPDSFSDGGKFNQTSTAIEQAKRMIEHGATIIDVGGESTRPGANEVSADEELSRVVPVIEAIKNEFDVVVSVDTSKPEVILESAKVGAGMINDVRALQLEGAIDAVVKTGLPVCLMHMQGQPKTMQDNPQYKSITHDIVSFIEARIQSCVEAGIKRSNIIVDPGFGFGKTLDQNYELLANLNLIRSLGLPILVGVSRKSMIGNLLNNEVHERLAGSLSAAIYARLNGGNIFRVHDVKETVDALKVINKTLEEKERVE